MFQKMCSVSGIGVSVYSGILFTMNKEEKHSMPRTLLCLEEIKTWKLEAFKLRGVSQYSNLCKKNIASFNSNIF